MAATAAPIVGTLTTTVVKGLELRDVVTLGTMSPYIKLHVGKESFQTKAHEKGGRTPTWNQAFIFNLDGKEVAVHLVAYNKGTLSDDVIGRVDIPISNLVKASAETSFDLVNPADFKKIAGKIIIKTEYKNPNAPQQPAVTQPTTVAPTQPKVVVMAQPQVVYQQPQVVYAQPGGGMMAQPQMVYGQPQMVYAQPGQQVVYMAAPQPGQQVVYMQPRNH